MYYVVNQSFIKKNVRPEDMKPHVDFVHQLIDSGVVVASGPFADEAGGGMIIVDADNEKEVKELVEKDPAVLTGILANDVRPYKLSFIDSKHSIKL